MTHEMNGPGVLLVEDDPSDLDLAVRAIREEHARVALRIARDGEEALKQLFDQPLEAELPKVVFLDLKLPKVDGLEVLRQIRSREATRCLPVVILTSSDYDEDIESAYRLGANSYIVKPVEFEKFSRAVREMGLYWLHLNESVTE